MVDVHDKATRSRNMSAIKGKDTKPEIQIRTLLHARGFRYRLHVKNFPGKPDIVLTKHKAVILINGCFWHGHGCHLFKWPATRQEFWKNKIGETKNRDRKNMSLLQSQGWRVLTIWECALKGKTKMPIDGLIETVAKFIHSDNKLCEIP